MPHQISKLIEKFINSVVHTACANKAQECDAMKTAEIGRSGGRLCKYSNDDDEATIADLLGQAGETLKKGETLTIDGETVKGSTVFDDGDEIIIMPSTTGA